MAKRKHIPYWERNEEQNHKTLLFRNLWCKVSGLTVEFRPLHPQNYISITPKVPEKINEDDQTAE